MIKLLKGVILIMENIQNKMSIFYAINLLDTHTHTHTQQDKGGNNKKCLARDKNVGKQ